MALYYVGEQWTPSKLSMLRPGRRRPTRRWRREQVGVDNDHTRRWMKCQEVNDVGDFEALRHVSPNAVRFAAVAVHSSANVTHLLLIRACRFSAKMPIKYLQSKTRAVCYLGVSDDADSESAVFIFTFLPFQAYFAYFFVFQHISTFTASWRFFFSSLFL